VLVTAVATFGSIAAAAVCLAYALARR